MGVRWSPEAKERIKKIPFFVRPFVKKRAEQLARERGLSEVTTELLAQLRQTEHKGRDD
jgi:hypothetical protein